MTDKTKATQRPDYRAQLERSIKREGDKNANETEKKLFLSKTTKRVGGWAFTLFHAKRRQAAVDLKAARLSDNASDLIRVNVGGRAPVLEVSLAFRSALAGNL